MPINMRAPLSAVLVVALASGCAGVTPPAFLAQTPPPPPAPSEYAPMDLSASLDAAQPGGRAMVTALFDSVEDTVLDLPEEYAEGWMRVVVSDRRSRDFRSANVVVPERNRRFISELARGQALDLFVVRAVHQDAMLASGAPTVILKVEKLRRHVPGAAAPRPAAAAAAPALAPAAASGPAPSPKDGMLVYANVKRPDDTLTLRPDGKFELKQYGKDVTGTYELEGEKLTFILPNGKRAVAKRAGEGLTDPDGKPWVIKTPLTK